MTTILRFALTILSLIAALFLIGLLYWLFYCNCGPDIFKRPGKEGAPVIILEDVVASVWDQSQTIGTQGLLRNIGNAAAEDLRITSIAVDNGAYAGPTSLPLAAGDLAPTKDALFDAIFKLSDKADGRARNVTVKGDYRTDGSGRTPFTVNGSISPNVEPPGPVIARPGEMVKQNPRTAFYPPAPPERSEGPNAESPVFVPIGPPRSVFPPTPSGTGVEGAVPAGAPVEIPVNTSTATGIGTPPDPNATASGTGVVMSTFNTAVQLSTDDGASFTNISLFTPDPSNPARTSFFPQSDGGLCCDQVVVYLERQNLFVWLLQYNPVVTCVANCPPAAGPPTNNITTSSRLRIAFATPEAIAADMWNAWTYGDLTAINRPGISSGLGIGANEWLDYPDLAWSDEFLYVSVDRGWPNGFGSVYAGRRLVARLRLSDMADTSSGVIRYDFAELTGSNGLNKSHIVQYAPGRFVLGSLDNSSTLRVFTWPDSSNTIDNDTVGISQIQQGAAYTSTAPDGSDWVGVGFPGNISGAAYRDIFVESGAPRRQEYIFAFTAGRNPGGGRPRAYVRLETLTPDGGGYRVQEEYDIWNADYAYAMAALGSLNTEIGFTLGVGGGTFGVPQHAVGFKDDFTAYSVTSSTGTQIVRFGDYFSTRVVPRRIRFGTEVYDIQLPAGVPASSACNALPAGSFCTANARYVEFGRPPPEPPF